MQLQIYLKITILMAIFLAGVKVGEWLILMYYYGIIFVLRTKSFTTYVANQYIEHKVQISDSNFSELLPSP